MVELLGDGKTSFDDQNKWFHLTGTELEKLQQARNSEMSHYNTLCGGKSCRGNSGARKSAMVILGKDVAILYALHYAGQAIGTNREGWYHTFSSVDLSSFSLNGSLNACDGNWTQALLVQGVNEPLEVFKKK